MDEEQCFPEYVVSNPKTLEASPIAQRKSSERPVVPPKPAPRRQKSLINSDGGAAVHSLVNSSNVQEQNAPSLKDSGEEQEGVKTQDISNHSYYNAPPKRDPPTPASSSKERRRSSSPSQRALTLNVNKKLNPGSFQRSYSALALSSSPSPKPQNDLPQLPETSLHDSGARPLSCYWGSISRTETEEKLRHHPDGSYLIRDSTTSGGYTLTVIQSGQTKCLKIFTTSDNTFGLKVNDCRFDSLSGLVQHYTEHSLADFNKQLTTRLMYPMNRPQKGKIDLYNSLSCLANHGRALRQKKHEYLRRMQLQERANQDVEYAQLQKRALEVAKDMYCEMLQPRHTQDDLDEIAGLDETRAKIMQKNDTLIMKRHVSFVERVEKAQTHMKASEAGLTFAKHDLSEVVDAWLDLEEQCAQIKDQVLECGAVPELVDCLLDYDNIDNNWDSKYWLMDVDRDKAESLLADREVGTFLIRSRHEDHLPFALSVVCNKEDKCKDVKHCMIFHPPGRGYGFSEAGAVFESVEELVSRHADISIKVYFPKIDTPLAYPVLAEGNNNRDSFGFHDEGNRN